MAEKTYKDFPSGTYSGTKILLQANATTGELEKILLNTIPGTGSPPGGSDTQVQFNDGGAFGGDSGLVYNKSTDIITLAGGLITGMFTASYAAKTANYAIGNTDHAIDVTANSVTITLPTVAGKVGRIFFVKNTGSGTVTMAATGGATIDGAAAGTITLSPSLNQCYAFMCTGAAWVILASVNFGGGSVPGSNTQVIFNDSGVLGADSGMIYDKTTDILTLIGGLVSGSFNATQSIKTADYTLVSNDFSVCMNSASAKTLTLPTAVGIGGKIYILKNINSGLLTIATTSAQTMDGLTTLVMRGAWAGSEAPSENCNQTLIVQSDNTNWKILSFKEIQPIAQDIDTQYIRRNGLWLEMIKVSASAPGSPYTGQFWFDIS